MYTPDEISNSDNVLDSRDIIKRIEYLAGLRDDFQEDNNLSDYEGEGMNADELWDEWEQSDEGIELHILEKLASEAGNAEDWSYGVTLIRDSYFEEYAEELVKEIGDLPKDLPWYIESNIDWKGVVEDIQQDYFSADFDGITYWVR